MTETTEWQVRIVQPPDTFNVNVELVGSRSIAALHSQDSFFERFSMKNIKRNVDYLIGEVSGKLSIHVGRGYMRDSGKYKQTLSVPVNSNVISDELYQQLLQFKSIFAIDSNKIFIDEKEFVASCAVHISLEYAGNDTWKNGVFTRLPALVSIATEGNPEPPAWRRLIEYVSPLVDGKVAIVVDSELGKLPFFNGRSLPICENFFLPPNTQLIYASSERDLTSPLNKAIQICDDDATKILRIISANFNSKEISEKILSSKSGVLSFPPNREDN